jgi:type II secretory pathway component GspD/PulD (secretin)
VLGQLFSKTAAGALSYQLLDKNWTVDTFVRALQEDADARILASPRILALSGLKASIETTEEIPYQQLTQTSEGGQIGTTAFKDAGVKLHVTPRVTGAGAIVLEVKAEQSAETGRVVGDIPVVSKHVAETTLLVNSGESVIMGGLRRTVNTKTRTQIPVLGDIPILGWPFRHTKTGQETRDLVVFLTPRLSSPAAQPRPGNMQGARNGEEQRPPQIVLPPGFK